MFVRMRIPLGEPHPALLVTDRAVGTDQGLKYLYVVDAQNKVQYRRVTLGPLEDDGLRVIAEGLEPDDWVVISGLQQIRPHGSRSRPRSRCRFRPRQAAAASADEPQRRRTHAKPDKSEAPQLGRTGEERNTPAEVARLRTPRNLCRLPQGRSPASPGAEP